MKKLIFIAFFISGLCSALFAQTDKATVEGVVRDSDGKPLSFATMFIAELGTGVSTDLEGKFRFTGTKGTEYTLNVSYLNHVDKEVKVCVKETGIKALDILAWLYPTRGCEKVTYDNGKIQKKVISKRSF